jgi:mono/diheme cytochrome c family protein
MVRLRTPGRLRPRFPVNAARTAVSDAFGYNPRRPMRTIVKWTARALAVILVIGVPAIVGVRPFIGPKARPLTDRRFEPSAARLERGRYLVTSAVTPCIICHSPLDTTGGGLGPIPGRELTGRNWAADGAPFVTAQNLTPDPETGIGDRTDDELARAIREGIGHDGRALFPIMPYQNFRSLPDEDLASIVIYLRSLKPVRNPLPPSAVPFPLNRLINGVPAPIDAPVVADVSTPEKRGAHLVTIAVCGDCHTPRDEQGTRPAGFAFAGGTSMPYEGRKTIYTANITPGVNGIPYYTEALFVEMMRTGKVKARQLDAMMPTTYYRNMTTQDLKDVFAYLKTLTPVDHYVDNTLPPTPCPKCGLTHPGGEKNKT